MDTYFTDAEKKAIALYAVLDRDIVDFIDLVQESSTEVLEVLHQMLTYPGWEKKAEEDLSGQPDERSVYNKELNAIGAPFVERELQRRKGS